MIEIPEVRLSFDKQQLAIHNDPATIKFLACGRRWGKTIFVIIEIIILCLSKPNAKVWYIANSYSQTEYAFNKLCKCGIQALLKINHTYPKSIVFPNGSTVTFKSVGLNEKHQDSLRGEGLDLIIVEEAAFLNPVVYYKILLPMITDRKSGKMIIICTFHGKNWFYTETVNNSDPTFQKGWIIPTHSGMKFQSERGKRIYEKIRERTPEEVFKEEFECIPNDASSDLDIEACLTLDYGNGSGQNILGLSFNEKIASMSFAIIRESDGAILDTGRMGAKVNKLNDLLNKYKPKVSVVGCRLGNRLYKHFAENKIKLIRYRAPVAHTEVMLSQLALDIQNKKLLLKKRMKIFDQLNKYKYDNRVTGSVAALAIACGYRNIMSKQNKHTSTFKSIPTDLGKLLYSHRHKMGYTPNPIFLFGNLLETQIDNKI